MMWRQSPAGGLRTNPRRRPSTRGPRCASRASATSSVGTWSSSVSCASDTPTASPCATPACTGSCAVSTPATSPASRSRSAPHSLRGPPPALVTMPPPAPGSARGGGPRTQPHSLRGPTCLPRRVGPRTRRLSVLPLPTAVVQSRCRGDRGTCSRAGGPGRCPGPPSGRRTPCVCRPPHAVWPVRACCRSDGLSCPHPKVVGPTPSHRAVVIARPFDPTVVCTLLGPAVSPLRDSRAEPLRLT